MKYFLVVYDRERGKIVDHSEYDEDERTRALADRAQRIVSERKHPTIEVVLLGAKSYEDLVKTHARYFRSPEQLMAEAKAGNR